MLDGDGGRSLLQLTLLLSLQKQKAEQTNEQINTLCFLQLSDPRHKTDRGHPGEEEGMEASIYPRVKRNTTACL